MSMQMFKIQCVATIEVPNDWKLDGSTLVLPDGSTIKPFVTLEKNEMDDLTNTELEALGASIEYGDSNIYEEECNHERTRMDDGISSCLDCGDRLDTDADDDVCEHFNMPNGKPGETIECPDCKGKATFETDEHFEMNYNENQEG